MRFYLTYKDHGFYDPVVDDTEVIYIPIDPEQLEIINAQTNVHEKQQKAEREKVEKIDFNQTGEPSTLQCPHPHVEEILKDIDIHEFPLLINVDEIPPGGKFRLPISETYDPEGNRVKLDKNKKEAVITFNVKKIVDEANEEGIRLQQQAQDAVSEYISESKINQNQEIKEASIKTDKGTDVNDIRDTALKVVNESIDRGISISKQFENIKTEIKTSEDQAELITKELSKSFKEKLENVNIRKESIKNIEYDVNVSEEIQKFEKIDTQTTNSNMEERKLLAKQDINETIQSDTVRRTSEIFKKENIEVSKPYRIDKNKDYDSTHTERDESIYRDSSAKQRAFSIGLKTIPHIRENINPLQIDYRLNLLTTFFLQLTNIMVTLSRFIAIVPNTYITQDSYSQNQEQCRYEKNKEKFDKSNEETFKNFEYREEGQGLSKYKYEHVSDDSEGAIIRKGKLSGAKIAQIEGRKTTELTDKMDTVISEFHKKTGFEEQSHDQSFRSHSGSRSKMKNEKNTFYGESQKQSQTDHRDTYEEYSETKTQSLDITEIKSEKHSFESETTKTEARPYAFEPTTTDDKILTYVAIVEAHVYTNKEAIFEEQMRREREMKTQNIEQTTIETNQDIRKLSLANTMILPEAEEVSVNESKEKVNITERAVTDVEQSTIKIAAKKISEILEPLVELTCAKSYSVNQTIVEDAKPIAETIEISIKEDELAVLDESKPHEQKPRQVVESMVKSVAETTEVVTGSSVDTLITPEVLVKTSRTAIESSFKATAETLTTLPEESKSDFQESTKITQKSAKVLMGEKVSSEVFEVSLIEQREESLEENKVKLEQPTLLLEESTFTVAQKSSISPVEPKSVIEIFTKEEKTANIKFDELKAIESTIINLDEPGNNILETPEPIKKYPLTSMEDPHLRVAQVYTILPQEPKDEHFEVSKITECKPSIDVVKLEATQTIIVSPEEPKHEQLRVLKMEEKVPETTIEAPSLKVAETVSMISEEPKVEFYIPEFKNQQAGITMKEFKAAETTIVEAEESKQAEIKILQPQEKKSKQIIEPSSLSVAIKTTEIVKTDEVGRSISPASPTTPVVEEYLFALEAELEHPYVVEEAVSEEASLRIKTQKKKIQSTDTSLSFTLAIENIIEADSENIETIEEIENIHLSKEVHESMNEGYTAKKSNMSTSLEIKSLDSNQLMSTEACSSHKVSMKNETAMEDKINISSLETNRNVSTATVNLDRKSISNEESHISEASLNKSRKMESIESQYSAGQEVESSVKSMQSISLGVSNKSDSSQFAEASRKQLSISASKSMESTVMEGSIELEAHQHLRKASGFYEGAASKSVKSESLETIESVSQLSTQVIKDESNASLINEKLTLRTDLKNTISNDGGQTSTPQSVPPTPLTDEYMFRLQTKMPEETPFIPRDCSISPESMHDDVVVNGLLTNYKTKIDERILYSPPLPTPPTSPEKAKPVYSKPGLKGGSDRQDLTKEEIHDSTLVSAIDRTLKQIEEYKASVGLTTEEMSYQQEDVGKEFTPIQIVEDWMDNEVHDKANNSEVEEIDAIKITVVTEDNSAGETAVTVMAEGNVDDDGDDLEIQEISSNFDEISLEIEHGRVLSGQSDDENKVDVFKPIQIKSDDNLEAREEDYEWVAVHPSGLNKIEADDERETINQFESEVLNGNAQDIQTTDKSQELIVQHDQEIIDEEAIIPPVESLRNSEVIKLLNEERTVVEERKWTTFLQKPYSPTPKTEVVYYGDFDIKTQVIPDAYRVKIVKQPKPKIAPDWRAVQLKKESSPIIEISEPQVSVQTEIEEIDIIEQDKNIVEEDINIIEEEINITEQEQNIIEEDTETEIDKEVVDKETEELDLEEMAQKNLAEELIKNVENMIDINASTDQQIEQMRDQLAALAQLPSVIQRTVELVHKRINLISQKEQQKKEEEEEYRRQEEERRRQEEELRRQEEEKREEIERTKNALELRVRKTEEELAILMKAEGKRRMIRDETQKKEKVELMKIDQESRKVTQRSTPRVGKPISLFGPIQERPVILPGGRKWRTPEDVYDDEFITESLVGQAEVIKGTAIGVNFMKFDKPPPALDHLKNSEVFKAIHDIEQPMKKVELLGPVLSEADYKERARSMSPCVEKVAEFSGNKQLPS